MYLTGAVIKDFIDVLVVLQMFPSASMLKNYIKYPDGFGNNRKFSNIYGIYLKVKTK